MFSLAFKSSCQSDIAQSWAGPSPPVRHSSIWVRTRPEDVVDKLKLLFALFVAQHISSLEKQGSIFLESDFDVVVLPSFLNIFHESHHSHQQIMESCFLGIVLYRLKNLCLQALPSLQLTCARSRLGIRRALTSSAILRLGGIRVLTCAGSSLEGRRALTCAGSLPGGRRVLTTRRHRRHNYKVLRLVILVCFISRFIGILVLEGIDNLPKHLSALFFG